METPYPEKRIDYLDNTVCLDALSSEEKKIIAEKMTLTSFKKNEPVIKQGSLTSNAVLIIEGLVKKVMEQPTGKKRIVELIRHFEFASLLFVLDAPSPSVYTITALERTVVGFIDVKTLKEIMVKNGQFSLDILLYNTHNFKKLARNIFSLNTKQMYARVADVLIDFSQERKKFKIPVTRVDMAQIVGVTPENLSNILKSFKQDGIVKINDRDVEVIKPELLNKISDTG